MNFRLLAVCLAFAATLAHSGFREGNGGDFIRSTYLRMGQAVLEHLKTTAEGQALVEAKGLDLDRLTRGLSVDYVSVQEGLLRDRFGSVVDATGQPESVVLSKDAWVEHFEKERDVYFLVFHEMLREAGVRDDDYVISGALYPFPAGSRITTRIRSLYPLISETRVTDLIAPSGIQFNGSGCPSALDGTFIDLDDERNQLEIRLRKFTLQTTDLRALDRKNCSIAIPVTLPQGQRIVFSQVDLSAKARLSERTQARLTLETFLPGTRGTRAEKALRETADPVQGTLLLRKTDTLVSRCGGVQVLRLNASATLQSNTGESSLLDADRLALSFRVENCN
jgi:hypothetical protein